MTSFVHIDYPQQHPGVARAEAVIEAAGRLRQNFDGTRGIAALLLAAVVSGLLVVADRLVDTWADDRLLAAWIVLWVVAFAALALFAAPARRLSVALVGKMDAWSARVAERRADERLWATAQTDARVMADLQAAITRSDRPAPRMAVEAVQAAEQAPVSRVSLRAVIQGWYRDVQLARVNVALLSAAEFDPRLMADPRVLADLRAAATRTGALPEQTQTLLRAEQAGASLRDAAYALGARRASYYQ